MRHSRSLKDRFNPDDPFVHMNLMAPLGSYGVIPVLSPCGIIKAFPKELALSSKILTHWVNPETGVREYGIRRESYPAWKLYAETCKDVELEDGTVMNEYDFYNAWQKNIYDKGVAPHHFPVHLMSQEAQLRRAKARKGGTAVPEYPWKLKRMMAEQPQSKAKKAKASDDE